MSRVVDGIFNIFYDENSEKYHKRDGQPSITCSNEDLADMKDNANLVTIRAHSSAGAIVAHYTPKELMKFRKTKVPLDTDRKEWVNKIFFDKNI